MDRGDFEPDMLARGTQAAYEKLDASLPEPLRSLAGIAAQPAMLCAEFGDTLIAKLDEVHRGTPMIGPALSMILDKPRSAVIALLKTLQGGNVPDIED